jgi:hypothetical protein
MAEMVNYPHPRPPDIGGARVGERGLVCLARIKKNGISDDDFQK